jgi:hypothetical protein
VKGIWPAYASSIVLFDQVVRSLYCYDFSVAWTYLDCDVPELEMSCVYLVSRVVIIVCTDTCRTRLCWEYVIKCSCTGI